MAYKGAPSYAPSAGQSLPQYAPYRPPDHHQQQIDQLSVTEHRAQLPQQFSPHQQQYQRDYRHQQVYQQQNQASNPPQQADSLAPAMANMSIDSVVPAPIRLQRKPVPGPGVPHQMPPVTQASQPQGPPTPCPPSGYFSPPTPAPSPYVANTGVHYHAPQHHGSYYTPATATQPVSQQWPHLPPDQPTPPPMMQPTPQPPAIFEMEAPLTGPSWNKLSTESTAATVRQEPARPAQAFIAELQGSDPAERSCNPSHQATQVLQPPAPANTDSELPSHVTQSDPAHGPQHEDESPDPAQPAPNLDPVAFSPTPAASSFTQAASGPAQTVSGEARAASGEAQAAPGEAQAASDSEGMIVIDGPCPPDHEGHILFPAAGSQPPDAKPSVGFPSPGSQPGHHTPQPGPGNGPYPGSSGVAGSSMIDRVQQGQPPLHPTSQIQIAVQQPGQEPAYQAQMQGQQHQEQEQPQSPGLPAVQTQVPGQQPYQHHQQQQRPASPTQMSSQQQHQPPQPANVGQTSFRPISPARRPASQTPTQPPPTSSIYVQFSAPPGPSLTPPTHWPAQLASPPPPSPNTPQPPPSPLASPYSQPHATAAGQPQAVPHNLPAAFTPAPVAAASEASPYQSHPPPSATFPPARYHLPSPSIHGPQVAPVPAPPASPHPQQPSHPRPPPQAPTTATYTPASFPARPPPFQSQAAAPISPIHAGTFPVSQPSAIPSTPSIASPRPASAAPGYGSFPAPPRPEAYKPVKHSGAGLGDFANSVFSKKTAKWIGTTIRNAASSAHAAATNAQAAVAQAHAQHKLQMATSAAQYRPASGTQGSVNGPGPALGCPQQMHTQPWQSPAAPGAAAPNASAYGPSNSAQSCQNPSPVGVTEPALHSQAPGTPPAAVAAPAIPGNMPSGFAAAQSGAQPSQPQPGSPLPGYPQNAAGQPPDLNVQDQHIQAWPAGNMATPAQGPAGPVPVALVQGPGGQTPHQSSMADQPYRTTYNSVPTSVPMPTGGGATSQPPQQQWAVGPGQPWSPLTAGTSNLGPQQSDQFQQGSGSHANQRVQNWTQPPTYPVHHPGIAAQPASGLVPAGWQQQPS
ncbi:hypothetical protein VTK56DRAFT_10183 [Thermocarpiscus australiensis]